MDTSLIIKSVEQGGRKLQKTIADVNPNADGTALKTWAQGLNALTTNTYSGTTKVNVDNLSDEEESGGSSLPAPAFEVFYTGGQDGSTPVSAPTESLVAGTPLEGVAYDTFAIATDSTANVHVMNTPAKSAAWLSKYGSTVPGDYKGKIATDIANPMWWEAVIAIPNPNDPDCLGIFEFLIDATETTSSATIKCNVAEYIIS